MNTRSQQNYENEALYEVNIDFDGASEAWKSNKKYIGNGSYKYITPSNKITPSNNTHNMVYLEKAPFGCLFFGLIPCNIYSLACHH